MHKELKIVCPLKGRRFLFQLRMYCGQILILLYYKFTNVKRIESNVKNRTRYRLENKWKDADTLDL